MNTVGLSLISAILLGLGATLMFDLWGLFLKLAFRIPPANICLVGRWLRYIPEGKIKHANIAAVPKKSAECAVGWIAHYTIGIMFAAAFVVIVGDDWLRRPTPLPAIGFGILTVLAPFLIMHPAFGFGVAASKLANPMQARLRSLMNHSAFGTGLYLLGWSVSLLLWGQPQS
jgi:hypothetical protein